MGDREAALSGLKLLHKHSLHKVESRVFSSYRYAWYSMSRNVRTLRARDALAAQLKARATEQIAYQVQRYVDDSFDCLEMARCEKQTVSTAYQAQ